MPIENRSRTYLFQSGTLGKQTFGIFQQDEKLLQGSHLYEGVRREYIIIGHKYNYVIAFIANDELLNVDNVSREIPS